MSATDAGMSLLGHLNSRNGVEIYAVRGVLNDQRENVVEIQESVISLILSHPSEFVSRRGGSTFRPINPLNFCAAGSMFEMRADGPMTAASCVFRRAFLNDLAEMEDGLCLENLDIVSGINSRQITELCQSMFREALAPGFASSIFAEATGTMIALEIARYNGSRRLLDQSRGGLASWQLRRLEDYLQANLSGDLSLEKLARLLNMSVRHLSRGVRREKGVTIQQWIAGERLQKARRLLSQGDLPINLIANETGFQNAAAFATAFKAAMGCTPTEFRKVCVN